MNLRADHIYRTFLRLTRRLSNSQIMMLLAVVVGVLAGVGTYLFEMLLYGIKYGLTNWFPVDSAHILFLIYPAVGIILATLFVKYIVRDNISEGVTRVLYAMSSRNSRIAGHNCWTSIVGGATTIGFGGSVGPEAPIVLTGAAIGSNVGRIARLNYKHTTLLLCCGAGAALAAIFKAPITGVVFVLEILMLDITAGSVIPLLIASITATTMAFMLRGFDPILAVTLAPADAFELWQIPLFILLGVCCGLMSWYFTSTNLRVSTLFKKIDKQYKKWIVGGHRARSPDLHFPAALRRGLRRIHLADARTGRKTLRQFALLPFQRHRLGCHTLRHRHDVLQGHRHGFDQRRGRRGRNIRPIAVRGRIHGRVDSPAVQRLLRLGRVDRLVHAGRHGGRHVGRDEGAADLDLPDRRTLERLRAVHPADDHRLHLVRRGLLPRSGFIYTKQLRLRGELLTHDKDQSVFVFLKLDELMETDFLRIRENFTLGDIVHIISTARRNIFPVIDNFGHLLGIIQLDDLREDMFKREKYGHPISDYMIQPPDKILEHEAIQSVVQKFEDKHTWMLPVVDKQNRYMGFISKSRILNAYREQLVKIQQ